MGEGVFKAFSTYFTGEADPLCFTGRASFFREESFWVSLGA
jgi:hypothetical protein